MSYYSSEKKDWLWSAGWRNNGSDIETFEDWCVRNLIAAGVLLLIALFIYFRNN